MMKRKVFLALAALFFFLGGAGVAVATDISRVDSPIGSMSFTHHVETESITAVSGVYLRAMDISCPEGAKSLGGGGEVVDANSVVVPIVTSYPGNDSNWVVHFNHQGYTSPFTGHVYVNCISFG